MVGNVKQVFLAISFLISLGLVTTPLILRGQANLCNGNLGENIFSSGDFGSGIPVVFPTDPGLAPGFIYTINVPPDDGKYTLTNDISKWSYVFPAWIRIGDNSPDPNGYMMVVNASVNPGIFYEQVIDNVCENTLYEFSADVINLVKNGVGGHILPNVSFLIDNVVLYSTGPIQQDEQWHTYGFTFVSIPGQTSIKLTLRNNAPGGPGNDLALDNIRFRACGPESFASNSPGGSICDNSLYQILTAQIDADTGYLQWQISVDSGMVWTDIPGAIDRTYQFNVLSSGDYYFRYLYGTTPANLLNPKCRIASDTILIKVVPITFVITANICEGLTYNFHGKEYGQTGMYADTLVAANGCDSIVILDLNIIPDPPIVAEFVFSPPACIGADNGSISVLSVSGTRPPFIFLINDSIVPAPSTSVMLPAGTYTARIENEFGCFDEQEIIIPDGPPLDINTIEDTTIILGHTIRLLTTANIPVWLSNWNPPDGLDCSNCLSPLVTPTGDVTYVVTAETIDGCTDIDSVRIRVDPDPVFYIPNIFSPNEDGFNDFFEISADPFNIPTVDYAIIFDRWGGIVSEKADLFNEGKLILWDGMTPAGIANPGVYVYMIKFTMVNGSSFVVKGDVTVLL
jgi:gliding motility-associated-like protein